jgi:chromosome segregation ATPase
MLTEEQIKKMISVNESLQVQLEDLNAILLEREKEIDTLKKEHAETTALRSKLDGQLNEIESIQNLLGEKQKKVLGAQEREIELHQELTEAARLQQKYNDLVQQYAYLNTQFTDIHAQLAEVNERNLQLQQIAGKIGELESKLEMASTERDELKNRLTVLESQKYLKEFNL